MTPCPPLISAARSVATPGRPHQRRAVARSDVSRVGNGQQAAINNRRLPALTRIEISISARQCQSVRLADGRTRDDFDRHVQIVYESPNNGELLGIFLAEVGPIRLNDVEQFGDDQ